MRKEDFLATASILLFHSWVYKMDFLNSPIFTKKGRVQIQNLYTPIFVNMGVIQNSTRRISNCRSWWGCTLWVDPSRSTLFARLSVSSAGLVGLNHWPPFTSSERYIKGLTHCLGSLIGVFSIRQYLSHKVRNRIFRCAPRVDSSQSAYIHSQIWFCCLLLWLAKDPGLPHVASETSNQTQTG